MTRPRLPLALCALLLLGCGEARAASAPAGEPAAPAPGVHAGPALAPSPSVSPAPVIEAPAAEAPPALVAPDRFLGSAASPEALLARMLEARPTLLEPVGSTSLVFKVKVRGDDGLKFAYKPRTTSYERGYRAEVAAYRISRLLGMDNVPPVVTRPMHLYEMESRFSPSRADEWPAVREATVWEHRETVGAAIYWIPEMRSLGLERPERVREWQGWLRQGGELPQGSEALARDLSTMLLFDYVVGNWDRMSGSNLQGLPDGSRIFVRDHNVAFAHPLPPEIDARILTPLRAAERFSRRAVLGLRAMDEATLRAELARDPGAARAPALADAEIAGVLTRRDIALAHVDEVVGRYGEGAALAFP